MSDVEAVRAVVAAINDAWSSGRATDCSAHIHPDVVMAVPGFGGRIEGRDVIVQSFVDFTQNADIEGFAPSEIEVDVTGDTAVATFTYSIAWRMGQKGYEGGGRDLWVLQRHGDRWLAVWRTMLNVEESEVD